MPRQCCAGAFPPSSRSTLAFEPTETKQGTTRRSDVRYSVRTHGGHDVRVQVLLEHQRKPERNVPLRVHEYLARSWLQQLDAKQPLVRIVPIVLFNGDRRWPYPTSVQGLMPDDGLDSVLGDLQVRGGFILVDLSQIDDTEIASAALGAHASIGLLLLKHAPSMPAKRFWALFQSWTHWVSEIAAMEDGHSRLVALLDYVGTVVGTPSRDELNIIAAELSEPAAEGVVTWAEALRQEGEEKGIAKGVRASLLDILRLRFGEIPEAVITRIEAADVPRLQAWMARAIEAPSLEGVFAD